MTVDTDIKRQRKHDVTLARIQSAITRNLRDPSQELDAYILEIATEVVVNGSGVPDYEDGVIDLLVNLYGARGDGDLILQSTIDVPDDL